MEGFGAEREAARQGIERAGGDAVLIEDYPSLPVSSRTACLDAISSSDVFLLIVGERGGWVTPSGKLVVEEEYEEARRRHLPILYLREDADRDEHAQRLDRTVSDYVSGVYRRTFSTHRELREQSESAVRSLLGGLVSMEAVNMDSLQQRFQTRARGNSGAYLHVVVAPERQDEVFDPVDIGDEAFERRILEVGHAQTVDLFDYRLPKEPTVGTPRDTLTVVQRAPGRALSDVYVSVNTAGVIELRVSVSGQRDDRDPTPFAASVILEHDVECAGVRCFAFVREFYQAADPYQRYARLAWNAALQHQGHQPILRELPRSSISMPMYAPQPAIAFDAPRPVSRQDLGDPAPLVASMLTMIKRSLAGP